MKLVIEKFIQKTKSNELSTAERSLRSCNGATTNLVIAFVSESYPNLILVVGIHTVFEKCAQFGINVVYRLWFYNWSTVLPDFFW